MTLFNCPQVEILSHEQIISDYGIRLSSVKSKFPALETCNTDRGAGEMTSSRTRCRIYSEATAELIKSWLLDCQTNHESCGDQHFSLLYGAVQSPPRPRRLLDLHAFQSPGLIQLIEAENRSGLPYCALSYSWSFSERYLLTSANIRYFQTQIQISQLPKTFQDAIEVARGIGFRYLWKDALCIMQDGGTSPAASIDWLDQAGKMNDIFGNSHVTIAASEAVDGSQGFIKRRNPLSQMVCRLDTSTKYQFEVVPPCTPHCAIHPFDNAQYHLDTRAWVLQERVLSLEQSTSLAILSTSNAEQASNANRCLILEIAITEEPQAANKTTRLCLRWLQYQV